MIDIDNLNHSKNLMEIHLLVTKVNNFVEQCKIEKNRWAYASTPNGPETLYASCFACMLLHYLGKLNELHPEEKRAWAEYLNSWQDPKTGLFNGPELVKHELQSPTHSFEHIAQHLAAHVLPALSLLDAHPVYPIKFAYPFLSQEYLHKWLSLRDWRDAWFEGNNLLFVGQFLIYLRDVEKLSTAQAALTLYFDWLDKHQDSTTGLWGTNGYCSYATALYGGYHQLLVYYYEKRSVNYPKQLVNVALSLQHEDGGFNISGGGGACEDTDAIDILVNMYKCVNYKRPQIRVALRKALRHILKRQMPDGGFVYRLNEPFMHMGVKRTASAANHSNLFSTWFRIHTITLLSEILTDEPIAQWNWQFNDTCSMGWHKKWNRDQHKIEIQDKFSEALVRGRNSFRSASKLKHHLANNLKSRLVKYR